jgi:putative phosphoribosyl transferase
VDDLICLRTPEDFVAVGLWYRDFEQVTDDEVVELLERARREHGAPEPE